MVVRGKAVRPDFVLGRPDHGLNQDAGRIGPQREVSVALPNAERPADGRPDTPKRGSETYLRQRLEQLRNRDELNLSNSRTNPSTRETERIEQDLKASLDFTDGDHRQAFGALSTEVVPLGQHVVQPIEPRVMGDASTNFLAERWDDMHLRNQLLPTAPGEIAKIQEQVREIVSTIGIETYLHEDLDRDVWTELANQTVTALQKQGAEFTEAEYMYVISETMANWVAERGGVDPKTITDVSSTPPFGDPQNGPSHETIQQFRTAFYAYRARMGQVYAKAGQAAAEELTGGDYDLAERQKIIEKHFPAGDRELFTRTVLDSEMAILDNQTENLMQELGEQFATEFKPQLEKLARGDHSISEFNRIVDGLKEEFLKEPSRQERISELQEQRKLNGEQAGQLFSRYVKADHPNRNSRSFLSLKNDSILDQALSQTITTVAVEKLKQTMSYDNKELDPNKRYGELYDLIVPEVSSNSEAVSAQEQRIATTESELYRYVDRDVFRTELDELKINDGSRLNRRTQGAMIVSRSRLEPESFDARQSLAFYDTVGAVSAEMSYRRFQDPNNPKATELTKEEANKLLDSFGRGEDLLQVMHENPNLLADFQRFFDMSAGNGRETNLGSELRRELDSRLTEARSEKIAGLLTDTKSYAAEREDLSGQLTAAREVGVATEQSRDLEAKLRKLDQSFQKRRTAATSILGESDVLNKQLSAIIANPKESPAASEELLTVQSGNLLETTAIQLHDAFASPDPISAIGESLEAALEIYSPAEIENALKKRYGPDAIKDLLADLPRNQQLLATGLLGGIKHPDSILARNISDTNRQFYQHRRKLADRYGDNSPAVDLHDRHHLAYLRKNSNTLLSNQQLRLETEQAVAGSSLLSTEMRTISLEARLQQDLSPEAFATLQAELENYGSLGEQLRKVGQSPVATNESYVAASLQSEAEENILTALAGGDKTDAAALRQLMFSHPNLAENLREYIQLRIPGENGQALAATISTPLQNSLNNAENVSAELQGLAQELQLDPERLSEIELRKLSAVADIDERSRLYQHYVALTLSQESATTGPKEPSATRPPTPELPKELQGRGLEEAQKLSAEASPIVAELIKLAQEYGPLLPQKGAEASADPWVRRLQEMAKSDYSRRSQELYSRLEKIDQNSSATIDLNRIQKLQNHSLAESHARDWLNRNLDSTWEQREEAGITEVMSRQDIQSITVMQRAKPITDFILKTEVEWANRLAEAEGNPQQLEQLQREKQGSVDKELDSAYRRLRSLTHRSEVFNAEEFETRIQGIVEKATRERKVTLLVDSLLEQGKNGEEVLSTVAERSDLNEILSSKQIANYAARKKAQLLLSDFQETAQKIGSELGSTTGLDTEFDIKNPSLASISGENAPGLLKKSREFQSQLLALSKEYPETIDANRLMALSNLATRRSQVSSWLQANHQRPWQEIQQHMVSNGGFKLIPPAAAKEQVFITRAKPVVDQLTQLHYQQGALIQARNDSRLPPENHAEAQVKYDALSAEIAARQRQLSYITDAFPEYPHKQRFKQVFTQARTMGLSKFQDAMTSAIEAGQRESQAAEDAKGSWERAWDIVAEGAKSVPKVFEAAEYLVVGNVVQLTAGTENAGSYLNWRRGHYNNFAGSVLGSDEQFAQMGDWEAAMAVNPLGHIGNALIEPVFNLVELGYDESIHGIYHSDLNYREFKELQKTDPTLKWSRRAFQTAEIAGSLALLLATGGGTTASSSVRIGRALKIMGVSSGMSVASAGAQELLNSEDFNFERFSDNTLQGTAHSMLFMAGTTKFTQAYVRLRFGSAVPATAAGIDKLRVVNPAQFQKLHRAMHEAQILGQSVDTLDGLSDMSQAVAQLGTIDWNDKEQAAGALIMLGVSISDVWDWQRSGAADAIRQTDGLSEVVNNFELNGVTGNIRFSGNSQAMFVNNSNLVRELFVDARVRELTNDPETSGKTEEEIQRIAREESQSVVAFADPQSGRMVVPVVSNGSRVERITATSFMVHEYAHLNGKTELEAWQAQEEYLNNNGYELDFSSGSPRVRIPNSGATLRTSRRHEIESFIARSYPSSAESRTGVHAAQAIEIEQEVALSDLSESDALDLVEEYNNKPADFSDSDRALLYWGLREASTADTDSVGFADDRGSLETAAKKQLEVEINAYRTRQNNLGIESEVQLSRQARELGLYDGLSADTKKRLEHARTVLAEVREFNSEPTKLDTERQAALHWNLEQSNSSALADNPTLLRQAATSQAVAEASQLTSNPNALSLERRIELAEQMNEFNFEAQLPAGVAAELEAAQEFGLMTEVLLEGGSLSESDLATFINYSERLELSEQTSIETLIDEEHPQYPVVVQELTLRRLGRTVVDGSPKVTADQLEKMILEVSSQTGQNRKVIEAMLYQITRYAELGGQRAPVLRVSNQRSSGDGTFAEPVTLHDVPVEGLLSLQTALGNAGLVRFGVMNQKIYTPGTGSVSDMLAYAVGNRGMGGTGQLAQQKTHAIQTTTNIADADLIIVDDVILQKIKEDANFAKQILESGVRLVIAPEYVGGIRMGQLGEQSPLANIQTELTDSVKRYQQLTAEQHRLPETVEEMTDTLNARLLERHTTGLEAESTSRTYRRNYLLLGNERRDGVVAAAQKRVDDGSASSLSEALDTELDAQMAELRRLSVEDLTRNESELYVDFQLLDQIKEEHQKLKEEIQSEQKGGPNENRLTAALSGEFEAELRSELGAIGQDYARPVPPITTLPLSSPSQRVVDQCASQLNGHGHALESHQVTEVIRSALGKLDIELSAQEQTLLIEALQDSVSIFDTRKMTQTLRSLHTSIESQAKRIAESMTPEGGTTQEVEVYYVVPKTEKSFQEVAGIFREANGVDANRFITPSQVVQKRRQARADGKLFIPVVIDDVAASGGSLQKVGITVTDGIELNDQIPKPTIHDVRWYNKHRRNRTPFNYSDNATRNRLIRLFGPDRARAGNHPDPTKVNERPIILAAISSTTDASEKISENLISTHSEYTYGDSATDITQTTAWKSLTDLESMTPGRVDKLIAALGPGYKKMLTIVQFPHGDTNTNSRWWQEHVEPHIVIHPDNIRPFEDRSRLMRGER